MAGFVTIYENEPPEIFKVGQIYCDNESHYVAIGNSWQTATWVPYKNNKDAVRKMERFFGRKRK